MRELRPEPRPMAGARAPLFERLAEGTAARGEIPGRVLNRREVVASVLAALGQLLNTRRPGGASREWVLDYGVPDFGGLSAASVPDRERYAEALTAAIAVYEPRLHNARLTLEPVAGEVQRLQGKLSGEVVVGGIREPVVFPLLLQAGSGEVELGGEEAS